MSLKLYLLIALRIVLLCIIGMVATLLPDLLRPMFGDILCNHETERHFNRAGLIDTSYHWGSRHYWYYWMMVLLFCLSLIKAVIDTVVLVNKECK